MCPPLTFSLRFRYLVNGPLPLLICLLVSSTGGLQATEYYVTSVADSGPGSLRQTIMLAQNGDTIRFDALTDGRPIMLDSTIELSGRRLTIIGNGREQTIISGSQKCRVFLFVEACVIDMRSLRIIDGYGRWGAAIGIVHKGSKLYLRDFWFEGNQTHVYEGGALGVNDSASVWAYDGVIAHNKSTRYGGGVLIARTDTAVLDNVIIRDNLSAPPSGNAWGGGIEIGRTDTVVVRNCAIVRNASLAPIGKGGGLAQYGRRTGRGTYLKLQNTTVAGNVALQRGGGVHIEGGEMAIEQSTIVGNMSPLGGGFSSLYDATTTFRGTIIANNYASAASDDVHTTVPLDSLRSLGYNLVRSDPGGYFRQRTTDLEGVNPRLRELTESDNTFYHPLFEDSPAIDAGDPDVRTPDQLGRPVNGRRDIGAYEWGGTPYFADFDEDGFGDPAVATYADSPPDRYVADGSDNCPYVFNPDQLDSDGNGVGNACEDDGGTLVDEFYLAALCAEVGGNWAVRTDAGQTFAVYEGSPSTGSPPADLPDNRVRFVVENALSGDYNLFAYLRAPNSSSDSYWVRVNGGAWVRWWQGLTTSTFAWREVVDGPFTLVDGYNTVDFAYREPGAALAKLHVTMASSAPSGPGSDSLYGCAPPVVLQESFWLEAECAAVGTNFVDYADADAAGGAYVVYEGKRSMNSAPPDVPENRVRFAVTNARAGFYNIYARLLAPNGNADSFWVRVNSGAWVKWASGLGTSVYAWRQLVGGTYELREGANTIDVAYREPNTRLDKLYFSIGGSAPTGEGDAAENCE